jgi:hypothetical protein
MLIEVLVLGGEEGLDDALRDGVDGDVDALPNSARMRPSPAWTRVIVGGSYSVSARKSGRPSL